MTGQALTIEAKAAQALPGAGSTGELAPGEVVETLKHMNTSTQKYAKWVVRVVTGRVVEYQFTARGETVHAAKFVCILVSKNPKEYMQGCVPFSFSNRAAAADAAKKFKDGTCWEISSACFEAGQKAEFISCPVKTVVKLTAPTGVRAINPTEVEKYNYASLSIHPPATLTQTMELLGTVRFQSRQSLASGPATKVIDLSCKIRKREPGEGKPVTKKGNNRRVLNIDVVDDSGALVELAVWDDAIARVPNVNDGCCIVGCTATKEGDGTKINVWDSALWITTGARAEALKAMPMNDDASSFTTLTSAFSGTGEPVDVSGTATPTCVVRLAGVEQDAVSFDKDLVFQINRCMLETPASSREELFTRDGARLFTRATVRDWTGACEVDVVEEAVPALFGCAEKSDVEARLCQPEMGGLVAQRCRVNVRGVIRRNQQGVIKRYIASIVPSPLTATISGNALVALRGLSEIGDGIVVAAPAERITHCPILGMAVQSDSGMKWQAHRVLMLVTGTAKSKLKPIPKAPGSASDCYLVESCDVKCLLGPKGERVHLRGYCNFDSMLDYRLDVESAVVVVSSVDEEEGGAKTMTVEGMEKVGNAEVAGVTNAMTVEYKAALMMSEFSTPEAQVSSGPAYWDAERRGVKRVHSEPATPARHGK